MKEKVNYYINLKNEHFKTPCKTNTGKKYFVFLFCIFAKKCGKKGAKTTFKF